MTYTVIICDSSKPSLVVGWWSPSFRFACCVGPRGYPIARKILDFFPCQLSGVASLLYTGFAPLRSAPSTLVLK